MCCSESLKKVSFIFLWSRRGEGEGEEKEESWGQMEKVWNKLYSERGEPVDLWSEWVASGIWHESTLQCLDGLKNAEQKAEFSCTPVLFDEMFLTWTTYRLKVCFTFENFLSAENEHRPPSLPGDSGQPAAERWRATNANNRNYSSFRKHASCEENFSQ